MQLARIKAKLALLKEQDRDFQIFGSGSHRYQLNPCVDPDSMLRIERELGLRLPEGYRRFLLEVGNGGAGPWYGLIPLEEAIADRKSNCWDDRADDYPLAKVFPFQAPPDLPKRLATYIAPEGYHLEDEEDEFSSDAPSDDSSLIARFTIRWAFYDNHATDLQELERQALRHFATRYQMEYAGQGFLHVSHFGCAIYCVLAISGDESGRIWVDPNAEFTTFYPLEQLFLDWYEHWLDSSLEELARRA